MHFCLHIAVRQEFDLVDGKLDFEEVDEKYCISFVFKGNWTIKLDGPGSTPCLDAMTLELLSTQAFAYAMCPRR